MKKIGLISLAVIGCLLLFLAIFSIGKNSASDEINVVTNPANLVADEGEEALLKVEASTEKGELTYQWYQTADDVNRNSDDIQKIGAGVFIAPSTENGIKIEGATSNELVLDTAETGVHSYYVEIKNGDKKSIITPAVTTAVIAKDQGNGSELNILFACGGNTGRSAMAEVIAKKVFSDKGIEANIDSVGTDIDPEGLTAEENAMILMKERGLDLSDHVAKMWTPEMLENSDLILVASESHKNRINVATLGIYSDKIFMLREYAGESGSIEDAFGKPMADYVIAADEITDAVNKLADRIEAGEPINTVKTSGQNISVSTDAGNQTVPAYSIGDASYVTLDDLTKVLADTAYEFSYTLEDGKLTLTKSSKADVDENSEQKDLSKDVFATPVYTRAFMDDENYVVNNYDIDGEAYYKISDFGAILGFETVEDDPQNLVIKPAA